MIRGYRDHAANERTFLAWVRTGIAVIAFGVVIEKLNLFVLALTISNSQDTVRPLQLVERLSGACCNALTAGVVATSPA
jgi:putative membrane protein